MVEFPTPKMFLICSYFLPVSASFLLQSLHYDSYSCEGRGSKRSKIEQLLSIAQAQIVPGLKQLRLKLTSQSATFLFAEY